MERSFGSRVPVLQSYMDKLARISGIPSVRVALSVGDDCHYLSSGRSATDHGSGMEKSVCFSLGCIGKALLSVVALELIEANALARDTPIGRYLPEMAGDKKARLIKIEHLLSHTVGYSAIRIPSKDETQLSLASLFEELSSSPQLFSPGGVFSYDFLSGVLLGLIIERVTGESVRGAVQKKVLDPLDIALKEPRHDSIAIGHQFDVSGKIYSEVRKVAPPGLLQMYLHDYALSAEDVMRIGKLLCTGRGLEGGKRILSEQTCADVVEPFVRLPQYSAGAQIDALPIAYTMGIGVFARGVYGADGQGEGQQLMMRFCPSRQVSIAVAVNAVGTRVQHMLMNALLSELGLLDAGSRAIDCAAVVNELGDFVGSYVGPLGTALKVSTSNHRVLVRVVKGETVLGSLTGTLDGNSLEFSNNTSISGVGFFREPLKNTPCIQLGLLAYKQSERVYGALGATSVDIGQ